MDNIKTCESCKFSRENACECEEICLARELWQPQEPSPEVDKPKCTVCPHCGGDYTYVPEVDKDAENNTDVCKECGYKDVCTEPEYSEICLLAVDKQEPKVDGDGVSIGALLWGFYHAMEGRHSSGNTMAYLNEGEMIKLEYESRIRAIISNQEREVVVEEIEGKIDAKEPCTKYDIRLILQGMKKGER